MKRALLIIAAIVVSNVAAWCLLAAASPFLTFALDPRGTSFKSALFMMFIMLIYGPIYILINFLPFSIIASLLGLTLHRHSRSDCIFGGVLTGLGFYVSLAFLFGPRDGSVFILGPLIGAICGWIYWLIAIRQTPDRTCPITTP